MSVYNLESFILRQLVNQIQSNNQTADVKTMAIYISCWRFDKILHQVKNVFFSCLISTDGSLVSR